MATKAIVGEKVGMTQVWDDENRVVPVTVLRVSPCRIVQVKTPERDGYSAIQVTFGIRDPEKLTRPEAGHFEQAGVDAGRKVVELRLDDETGEILMRHDAVFEGYWRNPEATGETIDEDGWLHTGDVAEWVDGTHVKIVDRIKDIIITAGGKNVSPSEIENTLKMSPFVGEAVVIGDRRKYLAALIGIDFDVVSDWAQRRRLPHTTYRDLSEKPEVRELVQQAVTDANANFASVEQIKKFVLMTKELDHEQGDLTATQKVKRSVVESKFSDDIESMYG